LILEYLKDKYPEEGCGVIDVDYRFFPIKNVAKDPINTFILNPSEYMSIKNIRAIVHSHPDKSAEPSYSDISSCNISMIPHYIYSIPSEEFYGLVPDTRGVDLMGRKYKYEVFDCLSAVIDYYYSIRGIDLSRRRKFWKEDWDKEGENYITEKELLNFGFKKDSSIKENSLILFAINSTVVNHLGVYVGDNEFYHHAYNRLSTIDSLNPFWSRFIHSVYTYAI